MARELKLAERTKASRKQDSVHFKRPPSISLDVIAELANAPCAMVPLKPNELRLDVHRSRLSTPRHGAARTVASTGMRNDDCVDDTIDDR